jgi:glycyl-tRNA synthetase
MTFSRQFCKILIEKWQLNYQKTRHIANKTTLKSNNKSNFNTLEFERTLKKRFFYGPSFSIYGGMAGLYDMGPLGCTIQNNLIQEWRKFFIIKDQMLEVDCSILTPEIVFEASGHLKKFSDLMIKDSSGKHSFRVDHLLKSELNRLLKEKKKKKSNSPQEIIELSDLIDLVYKIENSQISDPKEIDSIVQKYGIKSPENGLMLEKASSFNLMFQTQFGLSDKTKGYLYIN